MRNQSVSGRPHWTPAPTDRQQQHRSGLKSHDAAAAATASIDATVTVSSTSCAAQKHRATRCGHSCHYGQIYNYIIGITTASHKSIFYDQFPELKASAGAATDNFSDLATPQLAATSTAQVSTFRCQPSAITTPGSLVHPPPRTL